MMMRTLALSWVLILASCWRAPGELANRESAPAAAPTGATPVPSVSEASVATPAGPECPTPVAVAPRVLATGWPGLVGRRVRLRVVPVRAIDFTTWLVLAGGQRFVVVAAPDTPWDVDHVFVVAGAMIVPAHGRTSLPELIVADECET